ncbi:MAG: hypothetical protein NVSMB65_08710 [Chloroflexota bacterium]
MTYYPSYQMLEALQADRLRAFERARLDRRGLDVLTDEVHVVATPRPWTRAGLRFRRDSAREGV